LSKFIVFLEYVRGLRIFVLRRKKFKVHEEEHKGRKTIGKTKTTQRKKPASKEGYSPELRLLRCTALA
jgi:hypothetical protein